MAVPIGAIGTLAWRNLWRNYRRTLIMLAAIAVGVWAMIFMSALMRGMVDQMVKNGLEMLPGEVQVHNRAYRDDPSIVNSMSMPEGPLLVALNTPPVAAWSARLRVPAVIASERDSRGVTLLGVDPASEARLDALPYKIVEGRFIEGVDDKGIVIGQRLAERLETRLGKRVVIMSQDPDNEVADRGARVVGIFKGRLQAAEEQFVYTGLAVSQRQMKALGLVSEVAVTGNDYRQVMPWLGSIQAAAGKELEVLPWMELDAYLSSTLAVQDGFTLIFMVVIFVALSFGLVNTLVMALYERVREIGLMQALGMSPRLIVVQVLLESLYLLSLGLLAGNVLAWLSIKPLESGIDLSGIAQGLEMAGLSPVLYPALRVSDMWASTAIVISLGLLASLLPAWKAAQLDPVEALGKT